MFSRVSAVALILGTIGCSDSHPANVDGGTRLDASVRDAGAESDGGPPPLCSDGCELLQLVAGLGHTCALLGDGRVACWGTLDVAERIGLEPLTVPTEISDLPPMRSLLRGYMYTCGLSTDEELWCWGDGSEPLLGASTVPRNDWLPGLVGVVDVQAGGAHTCALLVDGSVHCWGFRNEGELGDGTTEPHEDPAPVMGIDDVVQIAAGAAFNCARTASGRVACWGDNGYGEIGDGTGGASTVDADRQTPTFVLDGVDHITAGLWFVCAHHTSGAVLCWGDDITNTVEVSPLGRFVIASPEVSALPEGVAIVDVQAATLGSHACALTMSGRVLCWGANRDGQIGYGGTANPATMPVEAGGIDDATAIALGFNHTCAVRDRHEVWCWGNNEYGQLGDGTRENRNLPVRVVGLD